ncbi:hypothetical protein LCGC14_1395140 [marine sediment metagenome]|uniref:Uncharacterized protein n=1 Tax=marine sediment metagenome TaxID=412755 RepID=A0A0F9N0A7_9ZZZZ
MLVDDKTAVMDPRDFEDLLEYSASLPTGTTIGKRWKAKRCDGWVMGEYEELDQDQYPGEVLIRWRVIEVVEKN